MCVCVGSMELSGFHSPTPHVAPGGDSGDGLLTAAASGGQTPVTAHVPLSSSVPPPSPP
jgi:hypothetical protein